METLHFKRSKFAALILLIGLFSFGGRAEDLQAYCVIDVSGGHQATYFPVSFLPSPPDGGWSDDYKLTKIVLRKVVPTASGTNGRALLSPYYLGLFEVTQEQYRQVTGRTSLCYPGALRPLADVLWRDLRGDSCRFNWPSTTEVDGKSFFGVLRRKTGLKFDLPSVAQWGYASGVDVNGKKTAVQESNDVLLKSVRCRETAADGRGGFCTLTTVGSYRPNVRGFYDLIGNVAEWCLDDGVLSSPYEGGSGRAVCGGNWWQSIKSRCFEDSLVWYELADRPNKFGNNRHGARVCLSVADGMRPVFREHPYCVVDLTRGCEPSSTPLSFLDAAPPAGWGREYKTGKLLLRRIEPGVFKFQGRFDVEITRPFYIGVFEVTERQYEHVMGKRFSIATPIDDAAIQGVSWEMIRADPEATGSRVDDFDWPKSRNVFQGSFVGRLSRLAKRSFDLPTEAQWEYACKAGTTNKYNIGEDVGTELDLFPFVRYENNPAGGYGRAELHVGLLNSNRWGLYDMLGNVAEICRDRYSRLASIPMRKDPAGPLEWECPFNCMRVIRGGSVLRDAEHCTSNSRAPVLEHDEYPTDIGFRVVMELPEDGHD